MKVGFTPMETYQMFRSLRREVFNYFDYDGKAHPVSFGVRPGTSHLFPDGTIAQTDFAVDPDVPWNPFKRITEFAHGIRFNGDYLPYVYEDELLNILLHELTHVTAGLPAQHDRPWQQHAREVGAIPEPMFILRNFDKMYPEGHYARRTCPEWYRGGTMDLFVGSL